MTASPAQRSRAVLVTAARLRALGSPHPAVGAAVAVSRGLHSLDPSAFAALLGTTEAHVRSLESGHRPAEHAPRRLREVEPGLDWAAVGIGERGDPHDPASRHPAAWRRPRPPA